ncbi:MAG: hypothetical protein AAGF84_07585 [Planctomycetota bacterium]
MRPEHRLPVVLITLVLLGQAGATVTGVAIKAFGSGYWDDTVWPFMDYPMYSAAHGPPVQASSATLAAELPDGTEIDVTAEFMGLAFFAWRYHIVERLVADVRQLEPRHAHLAEGIVADRKEAIRRVLEQVAQANGLRPVALRVDRRTHTITDEGMVITDTPTRIAVPGLPKVSRDLTEESP